MKRILPIVLLLTTLLSARFIATPVQECEAFNNMKHSKNTHNIVLKTGQQYTIIKKHKGQYLTLIKGENPAQRWVDDECFKILPKSDISKHTKKYKKTIFTNKKKRTESILVLSWHNAFCETHRNKQECRPNTNSDEGRLVLHGLWPQPRNNVYCNVPKKITAKDKHHQWKDLPNIDLEPETFELMDVYMPGYLSRLHKHEWIKHGTCYGTDANLYYHDALTLAKEVDGSKIGQLIKKHIGKKITLGQIRQAFDRVYGVGAGKKVEMKCKGRLLTELWINLSGQGDSLSSLIRNAKTRRSKCRQAIVDAKN